MAKKTEEVIDTVICLNKGAKFKFIQAKISLKGPTQYIGPSVSVTRKEILGKKNRVDIITTFLNRNDGFNLIICNPFNKRLQSFNSGKVSSTMWQKEMVTQNLTFGYETTLSTDFSNFILEKSSKWFSQQTILSLQDKEKQITAFCF